MKPYSVLLLLSLHLFLLTGCSPKYNQSNFLGKTSLEIMDEYGAFDCVTMPASENGLYQNCRCGYTITPSKTHALGTSDEILFFITFDKHGIAIQCEEGTRPGG